MASPPDENLPEAVPQPSLEPVHFRFQNLSATAKSHRITDESEKCAITYEDAPELLYDRKWPADVDSTSALSTSGSVPCENLQTGKPRICGLRRRVFFIILGVVLAVIIAASVGGWLGGTGARGELPGGAASPAETGVSSSSRCVAWHGFPVHVCAQLTGTAVVLP